MNSPIATLVVQVAYEGGNVAIATFDAPESIMDSLATAAQAMGHTTTPPTGKILLVPIETAPANISVITNIITGIKEELTLTLLVVDDVTKFTMDYIDPSRKKNAQIAEAIQTICTSLNVSLLINPISED